MEKIAKQTLFPGGPGWGTGIVPGDHEKETQRQGFDEELKGVSWQKAACIRGLGLGLGSVAHRVFVGEIQ